MGSLLAIMQTTGLLPKLVSVVMWLALVGVAAGYGYMRGGEAVQADFDRYKAEVVLNRESQFRRDVTSMTEQAAQLKQDLETNRQQQQLILEELQNVIQKNADYTRCRLDVDGVRIFNNAGTGQSKGKSR